MTGNQRDVRAPALSPGRGASAFSKLAAFLKRDILNAASYKLAFLYSFFGVFLSSATFFFIAKLVSPSTASLEPYGGDYFSFVIVGVAFSGLLGIFQDDLPGIIRQAQVSGTLEALLITPTSVPVILFGSSLYSFFFTTVRTVFHLGLGLLAFGMKLGHINWPGAVCVFLLTAACFLSIGILSASFTLVYKMGNPLSWVYGGVSGLMGGVVFPVSVLPPGIRWMSDLLPIKHSLEGMRVSLLSSAGFPQILPSIAALSAFSAFLIPLSLWTFRLALRKAKKDGTLTHY